MSYANVYLKKTGPVKANINKEITYTLAVLYAVLGDEEGEEARDAAAVAGLGLRGEGLVRDVSGRRGGVSVLHVVDVEAVGVELALAVIGGPDLETDVDLARGGRLEGVGLVLPDRLRGVLLDLLESDVQGRVRVVGGHAVEGEGVLHGGRVVHGSTQAAVIVVIGSAAGWLAVRRAALGGTALRVVLAEVEGDDDADRAH